MSAFTKQAIVAGFSQQQADFLDTMLAKFPHEHDMADIEGLEEALEEAGVEIEEEVED